jgi:hypothetical protein
MNTLHRIRFICLGALATAAIATAQPAGTGAVPNGVLGQRYGELSFGLQDIRHTSRNFYDVGLAVNAPVTANVDLSGNYSYGWLSGRPRGHADSLGGALTAYLPMNAVKPFASIGLGYAWTNFAGSDDDWTYGIAVGVEAPLGPIVVTPRAVFLDDFRSSARSSQQVNAGVEVHWWASRTAGLFASLDYADAHHSSASAWNWRTGVRFGF